MTRIINYIFRFFFMTVAIVIQISSPVYADNKRPNILLILADDMGFSDPGAFGSEIETPNIDEFAKEGVRFTNFYTNPMCGPTRATLMSGVDNHLAGIGTMRLFTAPNQRAVTGYEGWLDTKFKTLGNLMQEAGYSTYYTGKWDLGRAPELIPRARGFDRDFVMLDSLGSHYDMRNLFTTNPKLVFTEDGKYLKELPDDYYSSKTYTDKMISFIEDDRDSGKPFFAYLAYQAPHDPHHVDEPWRSMYQGKYDKGWTKARNDRFKAQQEMGLLPEGVELSERYWYLPDSEYMAPIVLATIARQMELYAAMMTNMDYHIGRIVQYLKDTGQYDNTIIMFMGDNGPEGNEVFAHLTAEGLNNYIFKAENWSEEHDVRVLGLPHSYPETPPVWAQVSATPFYGHKNYAAEGGIRNALIIKAPESPHEPGSIREDFMHISDIMTTLADLTGQEAPNKEAEGKSWLGVLNDPNQTVRTEDDWVGWEIDRSMALRKGDWKVLNNWKPYGTGEWQLFNLENDWAERHDMAQENPEKLNELVALFENEYMVKNKLVLGSRALNESLWWDMPLRFPVYDGYPPALYRKQFVPPADMLVDPKN